MPWSSGRQFAAENHGGFPWENAHIYAAKLLKSQASNPKTGGIRIGWPKYDVVYVIRHHDDRFKEGYAIYVGITDNWNVREEWHRQPLRNNGHGFPWRLQPSDEILTRINVDDEDQRASVEAYLIRMLAKHGVPLLNVRREPTRGSGFDRIVAWIEARGIRKEIFDKLGIE